MTLRILVAPDSFKGSLSSPQVCQAMEIGIRAVVPDATVHCFPMADGGEGTMEAVVSAWQSCSGVERQGLTGVHPCRW